MEPQPVLVRRGTFLSSMVALVVAGGAAVALAVLSAACAGAPTQVGDAGAPPPEEATPTSAKWLGNDGVPSLYGVGTFGVRYELATRSGQLLGVVGRPGHAPPQRRVRAADLFGYVLTVR